MSFTPSPTQLAVRFWRSSVWGNVLFQNWRRTFEVTMSAISQHMRVLRDVELVTVRSLGRERLYQLNPEPLRPVSVWLRTYEPFWAEQTARPWAIFWRRKMKRTVTNDQPGRETEPNEIRLA